MVTSTRISTYCKTWLSRLFSLHTCHITKPGLNCWFENIDLNRNIEKGSINTSISSSPKKSRPRLSLEDLMHIKEIYCYSFCIFMWKQVGMHLLQMRHLSLYKKRGGGSSLLPFWRLTFGSKVYFHYYSLPLYLFFYYDKFLSSSPSQRCWAKSPTLPIFYL